MIEKKILESFDKSKIYYEISRNDRNKDFLVFIHGIGVNHTMFKYERNHFIKKNFNVIVLDLRGHGLSENNKEKLTLKDFAKDLELILRKEKVKKVILVGHSMGGFIAIKFYSLFRKYVKSMVLVNSSYALTLRTVRYSFLPIGFLIGLLIYIKFRIFKHKYPKEIDFSQFKGQDMYITYLSLVSTNFNNFYGSFMAMINEDMGPILKKIHVPILIIEDEFDNIFKKLSYHFMHVSLPNSKIKLGQGEHDSVMQRPRDTVTYVSKFLRENY